MPPARYSSPFPRLELSDEEKKQLQHTADSLVDEVHQMYEQFLGRDRGRLDESDWEQVREREDVRVFHNRRPGAGTGNMNMHLLLTIGTVVGTLNDVMYGVLNHTTDDMRIKTAYLEDTLIDGAVLEPIIEPTREQPFQSLTVKWFVKGLPLLVRTVSKHRDFVLLEATGVRTMPDGESIGYHLMHSVAFGKAPLLPEYERSNMSFCTLWRQVAQDRVEAMSRTYALIEDTLLLSPMIKSIADALVALWKIIPCAQKKKLTWLVQNRKSFVPAQQANASTCVVCSDPLSSSRRDAKYACGICANITCKRCVVKHDLVVVAPNGQLVEHKVRFCLSCMTKGAHLDAGIVATDAAVGGQDRTARAVLSNTFSESSGER